MGVVGTNLPVAADPIPPMFPESSRFDLEQLLPMALIRAHTKTNDIIRVTDEQMKLYRQAAFEAAELYTGLLLQKLHTIEEPVILPRTIVHDMRKQYKMRLKYPAGDDYVYIVGPGLREMIPAMKGKRKLIMPNLFHSHDFMACCNPCNNGSMVASTIFKAVYRTGYTCAEDIPAGIKLGMLKYIAWNVENPGDIFQSVRGNTNRGTGAQDGTNNAAWASGALEHWIMYNSEIT